MRLRFHFDEHMPTAAVVGLRRRGVDATSSAEVGLLKAGDDVQLAHAHAAGRVMVTCDADYLRLHAVGQPHSGVAFWLLGNGDVGGIVRSIELVAQVYDADDLIGVLQYLP